MMQQKVDSVSAHLKVGGGNIFKKKMGCEPLLGTYFRELETVA